jgi:hypothetical protein
MLKNIGLSEELLHQCVDNNTEKAPRFVAKGGAFLIYF